jgi:hypothetical protein
MLPTRWIPNEVGCSRRRVGTSKENTQWSAERLIKVRYFGVLPTKVLQGEQSVPFTLERCCMARYVLATNRQYYFGFYHNVNETITSLVEG